MRINPSIDGMFIESETYQTFCIDAPLSLISRDLDAIEFIVLLLLLCYNVPS